MNVSEHSPYFGKPSACMYGHIPQFIQHTEYTRRESRDATRLYNLFLGVTIKGLVRLMHLHMNSVSL
jgi:hypothetical protein